MRTALALVPPATAAADNTSAVRGAGNTGSGSPRADGARFARENWSDHRPARVRTKTSSTRYPDRSSPDPKVKILEPEAEGTKLTLETVGLKLV